MTKEDELRAEVESLRAAYRAAGDQIRLLDDVAGQLRAAIDNLQAEQAAAPTIGAVLREDGFAQISSMFPQGLHGDGHPLHPTAAAIHLIWSLVYGVEKRDAVINEERALAAVTQSAYHVEAERNIELALKVVRLTNALAEYALRAVERPMGGEL